MGIFIDIQEKLTPLVENLGFTLWGCRWCRSNGAKCLQIFIDKEEGITVDDCAFVSRNISVYLDVELADQSNYILEVSSPGMDRFLFSQAHFVQSIGKKCKVTLKRIIEGRKRIVGRIIQVEETICLSFEKDGEQTEIHIAIEDIEQAKLIVEV